MGFLSARQALDNQQFPLDAYFAHAGAKLVCCAIPKSGCSTIKRWMLQNLDPQACAGCVDVHKACRDRFSLALVDRLEAERVLAESFRFACVRDPLSRLASAFIDKFCGPVVPEMTEGAIELIEAVHRRRGVDVTHDTTLRCVGGEIEMPACSSVNYVRGVTFQEFVEHVCDSADAELDLHWRPQSSFIEGRTFHLLARSESLTSFLRVISRELGLAEPAQDRVNPTLYTDGLVETRFAELYSGDMRRLWVRPRPELLYTPELRARVLDRFADDAKLFAEASIEADVRQFDRFRVPISA